MLYNLKNLNNLSLLYICLTIRILREFAEIDLDCLPLLHKASYKRYEKPIDADRGSTDKARRSPFEGAIFWNSFQEGTELGEHFG